MVDLTVIILTKNEEKNLKKCIESFQGIAKRFVIVDSFSTDRTEELCINLKQRLQKLDIQLDFYQNEWIDYATQLNWGLMNTEINTKWTMRMDADEELTKTLADEIDHKLKSVPSSVNGIIIRRRLIFMGRWIKHGGRYPELLLRIFRTGKAFCEQRAMDEHMILSEGQTIKFQCDLIDNNQKDLEWWISKHNWYSNREALDHQTELLHLQKSELETGISTAQAKRKRIIKTKGYYKLPAFWRAYIYFFYRYYLRLGFLDGTEGKIFHFLQAYWYRFLVDAKLYESQKKGVCLNPPGDLKA